MSIKICIVEDDALIAQDVRDQIVRLGYEVGGIARDGDQALQMISLMKPDLILMDVLLKGKMTGVEIAELFEKDYGIPVIFLTGIPKAEIENISHSDPCNYLSKPFSDGDLKECIENALKFYSNRPPDDCGKSA